MANTKVTSRVLANDAVLTANITDANITTAKIADNAVTGDKVADDVALAGNPTTTTQSAGNNTTRIATTAFVTTAVANIVDSAPSALDTLNELAAALGDDANFSTTVTNSIATKAPLASPTFTGDVDIDATDDLRLRFLNGGTFKAGIQVPTSTGDMISGAAVDDLAIRSQANMLFSSGGNTERMRIASSTGHVGIGITSPRGLLDLGSGSGDGTLDNTPSNYQLILEAPQSTTGDIGRNIAFVNSTNNVSAAINAYDAGTGLTNGLSFSTASSGTLTEHMSINHTGQLLIGQASGDAFNNDSMLRLQRAGDRVFIQFKTDADQNSGILFGDVDDDVECAIEYEPANKALTFSTGNNVESFRITEQGTIGMPATGSGSFAGSLLINHDGTTGTLNNAYYNTGFGYEVFDKITSGDNNTAIGNQAAYDLTTGSANSLFGRSAGANINSGNYNTLGGYQAGDSVTDGEHNTAWGYEALGAHNGSYNTAIGDRALHANTGGSSNVAVGSAAMYGSSNTANQNTAVGANSMEGITTGQGNAMLGHYAGYALTSGSYNVAVGRRALMGAVTGSFNIALGYESLMAVTSGGENVCIGRDAGHDISTGTQNVAVGHESLTKMSSNSASTAVGFQALEKATGANNTGIGYKAGEAITSGTNNMMLGKNAGTSSSPIGAISTSSNNICLGDDNIAALFCVQSSINTSDRRDKTDIENFTIGLDFINKMQPVTYKWDRRSWYLPQDKDGNITDDDITKVTPDGSKKEEVTHVGFIAQDVETLEKEIGYASDNSDRLFTNLTEDGNRYGMKYDRLVTVLVNSVKELSTKLDAAEARIKTLEES